MSREDAIVEVQRQRPDGMREIRTTAAMRSLIHPNENAEDALKVAAGALITVK